MALGICLALFFLTFGVRMYKAVKNFSCAKGNFAIGQDVKEEDFKDHKEEFKHLKDAKLVRSNKDLAKEGDAASDAIKNPGKKKAEK